MVPVEECKQFGANLRFFVASFTGTVGDNVRYGPTLEGKTLSEAAVTGLLRLADLDASFANKSIIGLSVGQAQRVALARTLANEPEVSFCAYAFVLFNCLDLNMAFSFMPKSFFKLW